MSLKNDIALIVAATASMFLGLILLEESPNIYAVSIAILMLAWGFGAFIIQLAKP